MNYWTCCVWTLVAVGGCAEDERRPVEVPQLPPVAISGGTRRETFLCDEAVPGERDPRTGKPLRSWEKRASDDRFSPSLIDRRTVSCREYRECVRERACPALDCLESNELLVWYKKAEAYCAWKGGQVATYGQWARAVLGADGKNRPPFSDMKRSCFFPTGSSRVFRRCEAITLEGVVYATRSHGEWTRSTVCTGNLVADTYDHEVTRISVHDGETHAHEFRCVYEQPSAP